MLTLYEHPFALYCQKVLIALNELDLVYEVLEEQRDFDREELAAVWPPASIPVLRDGDRVLGETTIIIVYGRTGTCSRSPGRTTSTVTTDPGPGPVLRLADAGFLHRTHRSPDCHRGLRTGGFLHRYPGELAGARSPNGGAAMIVEDNNGNSFHQPDWIDLVGTLGPLTPTIAYVASNGAIYGSGGRLLAPASSARPAAESVQRAAARKDTDARKLARINEARSVLSNPRRPGDRPGRDRRASACFQRSG